MDDMFDVWATYMAHKRDEEGPKPTACGTLLRVSDTGSCLRQRALSALGVEESEEIDAGTLLAFQIGNSIHDALQQALLWKVDDAQVEIPIDLRSEGVSLSGHCDGLFDDTILEIKTVGAYAAKLAWKKGPKPEHVAQAALYAAGTGATHVLLVYVAKEKDWRAGISPGDMREWLFHVDDDAGEGYSPRDLGEIEMDRFKRVERSVDIGLVPARLIPNDDNDLVVESRPGLYGEKSSGSWQCRYCRHNTTCQQLGEGQVPVREIGVML